MKWSWQVRIEEQAIRIEEQAIRIEEQATRIETLEAALRMINLFNSNSARFDTDIDAMCRAACIPEAAHLLETGAIPEQNT